MCISNTVFSLLFLGKQIARPSEQFEECKWASSETERGLDQHTKRSRIIFSYFFTVALNVKAHWSTLLIFIHSRSRNSRSPWKRSLGMSWMPILSFPIFTRYFWFLFWHTFFSMQNISINDLTVALLKLTFYDHKKNGITVYWWTTAVCQSVKSSLKKVNVRAFTFVLPTFNSFFFLANILTGCSRRFWGKEWRTKSSSWGAT